jgi:hypothetical protein
VATAEDIAAQRDKALEAAAEAEKQKTLRRVAAYQSFFESRSGLEVLECLRESCDGNTFRPDPYEAAYAAGRRSVFLNIMQTVEKAHELLQAVKPISVASDLQRRGEMPATIEEL